METTTLTRSIGGVLGAAIFAIGLFAFAPATDAAQDQQAAQSRQGDRGPGGFGGRGGRDGGPGGGGFGNLMRNLTDAQEAQVRTIRERHAAEMEPLMERSRVARAAIEDAVLSGNAGNLQALSIEVGNAETELTFARAQVQAEIFAVLTPAQKQQIAERRKEVETRRAEILKRRQETRQ